MMWPKSETSDFGWGEGVPPCRDQAQRSRSWSV